MASHWLETRLYFGLSLADAPANPAIEARWQTFLDHEVTRRFPAGLTVMDAYGQWLPQTAQSDPKASPKRLRSKVLIILHPGSAENAQKIDEIRAAWKKLTGEQSVLKVTEPAEVSF